MASTAHTRAGNLDDAVTVQRWLAALSLPDDREEQGRIAVLAQFLQDAEQGPDELVASLFRDTEVGRRIKLKRRRVVMEQIAEWEKRHGRPAGNVVRSFLIHNGVALTAPPIRW